MKTALRVLFITTTLSLSFGCKHNGKKSREIEIPGYKVIGNISSDSIYNGEILFYDQSGKILLKRLNYKNGILDGPRTEYYPNGQKQVEQMYENGKVVGYTSLYDSAGKIAERYYIYYDLPVGGNAEYTNGVISDYVFYSFEGEPIYVLDYQELKSKPLAQVDNSFFSLIHYKSFSQLEDGKEIPNSQYGVYLLSPPLFTLKYDLVVVDSSYSVKKIVEQLRSPYPFISFSLPGPLSNNLSYAIRLTVADSTGETYTAYKKLGDDKIR